MAMLFLSGATIPLSVFPEWLQLVTQFVPATYFMIGISGILQSGESVWQNWQSVIALVVTGIVGLFIATKIFRWEKEEKLRNREVVGARRARPVSLAGHLSILEQTGPGEGENPRARHGSRKDMVDPERPRFRR